MIRLISDFRYDEGFRIRQDSNISPSVTTHTGGAYSHDIWLIEVDEDTNTNNGREKQKDCPENQ